MKPNLVIRQKNENYIHRWYIIPRNKWFNVYLHKTLTDDYAVALHDHPWWNISIVLWGGYFEHKSTRSVTKENFKDIFYYYWPRVIKWRRPGTIIFRRATDPHKLTLSARGGKPIPSWSLFITGPVCREWGFHTQKGWIEAFKIIDKQLYNNTGISAPIPSQEYLLK